MQKVPKYCKNPDFEKFKLARLVYERENFKIDGTCENCD